MVGISGTKVNWVLEVDVRSFFDEVSQEWLIRSLEHRIARPRIIRLIKKWLRAGILEDGVVTVSDKGTGQGSVISPLLANVYLHYSLDLWAERCWRRRSPFMAVKDFRYNAWYGPEKAPRLDPAGYRLQLAGRIDDKRPWTVNELNALPQVSQVTRHVCVEGWSMIGKWSGTPLRTFLERIGADTTARYVGFECADGYYEGIDMPTALHPPDADGFPAVR